MDELDVIAHFSLEKPMPVDRDYQNSAIYEM